MCSKIIYFSILRYNLRLCNLIQNEYFILRLLYHFEQERGGNRRTGVIRRFLNLADVKGFVELRITVHIAK